MMVSLLLSLCRPNSEMSTPSINIRPEAGSINLTKQSCQKSKHWAGEDSPEEGKSERALASACASNNANSFSSLSNITHVEGKAVPTVAHLNCGGNLSQDQVKSLPISSAVVLKLDLALPTEEIETIAPII